MKRRVLIVSGAGFSDQDDIVPILEARGDEAVVVPATSRSLPAEAETADTVLLRGAWTTAPEESLLVRALTEDLDPMFRVLDRRLKMPPKEQPVVAGIGRGALILLFSKALALCDYNKLVWMPTFDEPGVWVDVRFKADSKESFPALIRGRALPMSEAFGPAADASPWIFPKRAGAGSFGWRLRSNVYVSFVDLLAFGERSQLPDYGYRDLLALPSQSYILQTIVDGDA